jgi:hypothetical protein
LRFIGRGPDVRMGVAIPNATVFSLGLWVVAVGLKPSEKGFIDFRFRTPATNVPPLIKGRGFPCPLFHGPFYNTGVIVFIRSDAPFLI